MKITALLLIVVTLSGCFGKSPVVDTGFEGKPMPSVNLLLLDSTTHINLKTTLPEKPIVLFYFSPHCTYCRTLTDNIIRDIKNLSGIQFYMLSSFPLNEIKEYTEKFNLDKYNNILVAQDFEQYFTNYFKAPAVPFIAIYGKNRLLIRVLMGTVSTNLIKDLAIE